MTRPLLPPRGIFVGSALLFEREMPAPVRETLLQLMALAWSSSRRQTPTLTLPILQTLTRKSQRTLRAHLALLRSYPDVLRLHPAGKGHFTVTLAGWLYGKTGGGEREARRRGAPGPESGETLPEQEESMSHPGKKRPFMLKEEEQDPQSDTDSPDSLLLPEQARRKQTRPNTNPRPENAPGRRAPRLSADLEEELRAAGVFPGLLPEVAGLAARDGHSESDLRALLAWCQDDEPRRPAALFVARLRIGARAPDDYRRPACPRCGQRGGHSPECPRRYAMDET